MKSQYAAIIIDDDEQSATMLSFYLEKYCSDIDVVGYVHDFKEAIAFINKEKPDIIFLDIFLNNELGFEILDLISYKDFQIIFISGSSEYAVKMFQYHPVDYLLKPFDVKQLLKAVNKSVKAIKEKNALRGQNKSSKEFLGIHTGEEIKLIKIKDLIFCESRGSQTLFNLIDKKIIMGNKNIGFYEEILPNNVFFRIHKKYIVNFEHVIGISKNKGYLCELSNEQLLPIARRKQEILHKILYIKKDKDS